MNHKFRVWDNTKKIWLLGYKYPNLGGFNLIGETMMFGAWAELLSEYFNKFEHLDITQCSGLKDKNGCDIYAGDILKVTNLKNNIQYHCEVFFEHGCFKCKYFGNDDNVVFGPLYRFFEKEFEYTSIEVISNIFEQQNL